MQTEQLVQMNGQLILIMQKIIAVTNLLKN